MEGKGKRGVRRVSAPYLFRREMKRKGKKISVFFFKSFHFRRDCIFDKVYLCFYSKSLLSLFAIQTMDPQSLQIPLCLFSLFLSSLLLKTWTSINMCKDVYCISPHYQRGPKNPFLYLFDLLFQLPQIHIYYVTQ